MKYIYADKLIAEIERMRKINRKAFEAEHIESDIFHGRTQAINHLFEFITSLQQEQSEVDLEKEIQDVIHNHFFDLNGIAIAGTSSYATVDDMVYIAKHFFELGLNTKG